MLNKCTPSQVLKSANITCLSLWKFTQESLSSVSYFTYMHLRAKNTVIMPDKYKSYTNYVFHQEKGKATLRKIKHKDEPVQTLYQLI